MSWPVSLRYESEKEEEVRKVSKEEHKVGVVHTWMQVGGFPALAEEDEAQGCYVRYSSLLDIS